METANLPSHQEQAPAPHPVGTCPVCGGYLIPLQMQMRCGRCGYSRCDACEGRSEAIDR
jgi:hypothetical protein